MGGDQCAASHDPDFCRQSRATPCWYYARGQCTKGDACAHSHDPKVCKQDDAMQENLYGSEKRQGLDVSCTLQDELTAKVDARRADMQQRLQVERDKVPEPEPKRQKVACWYFSHGLKCTKGDACARSHDAEACRSRLQDEADAEEPRLG